MTFFRFGNPPPYPPPYPLPHRELVAHNGAVFAELGFSI